MTEHKIIRVDGGLPGIGTRERTPAVATCSCGAVGRGKTRKGAIRNINHRKDEDS